jgi:hypothetical protein
MRQQLELRLQQLKQDYESGQRMMVELDAKQANLKETLLRISGAIQVIEEELAKVSVLIYGDNSADGQIFTEKETPDGLLSAGQQSSE